MPRHDIPRKFAPVPCAWFRITRRIVQRKGLPYPSDPTNERALIEPMVPPPKRGGRRRPVDLPDVVQGLLQILETGCGWRHPPKDFPPRGTVREYFELRDYDRTLERISRNDQDHATPLGPSINFPDRFRGKKKPDQTVRPSSTGRYHNLKRCGEAALHEGM